MTRRAGLLATRTAVLRARDRACGDLRGLGLRGPNGEPVVADGWRSEGSVARVRRRATSARPGRGSSPGSIGNVDLAANQSTISWHFTAPANTRIARFRLWRWACVEPREHGGRAPIVHPLPRPRSQFDDSHVDETCFSRSTAPRAAHAATPLGDANLRDQPAAPDGRDIWHQRRRAAATGTLPRRAPARATDSAWVPAVPRPRSCWPTTPTRPSARRLRARCSPAARSWAARRLVLGDRYGLGRPAGDARGRRHARRHPDARLRAAVHRDRPVQAVGERDGDAWTRRRSPTASTPSGCCSRTRAATAPPTARSRSSPRTRRATCAPAAAAEVVTTRRPARTIALRRPAERARHGRGRSARDRRADHQRGQGQPGAAAGRPRR